MAAGGPSSLDNIRSICEVNSIKMELQDLLYFVTPCFSSQWKALGHSLGIPLAMLTTIEADNASDVTQCCTAMLRAWFELDPTASWAKLFRKADSLKFIGTAMNFDISNLFDINNLFATFALFVNTLISIFKECLSFEVLHSVCMLNANTPAGVWYDADLYKSLKRVQHVENLFDLLSEHPTNWSWLNTTILMKMTALNTETNRCFMLYHNAVCSYKVTEVLPQIPQFERGVFYTAMSEKWNEGFVNTTLEEVYDRWHQIASGLNCSQSSLVLAGIDVEQCEILWLVPTGLVPYIRSTLSSQNRSSFKLKSLCLHDHTLTQYQPLSVLPPFEQDQASVMTYAILLEDRVGIMHTKPLFGKPQSQSQFVPKGSLLIRLTPVNTEINANTYISEYKLETDDHIRLHCDNDHLQHLNYKQKELLLGVEDLNVRLEILQYKLHYAESLFKGAGVKVLHASGSYMRGCIQYMGLLPKQLGTHFGIQLLRDFQGKGDSNGSFRGCQYFKCHRNCAMFVTMDKLVFDLLNLNVKKQLKFSPYISDSPTCALGIGDEVKFNSATGEQINGTVEWIGSSKLFCSVVIGIATDYDADFTSIPGCVAACNVTVGADISGIKLFLPITSVCAVEDIDAQQLITEKDYDDSFLLPGPDDFSVDGNDDLKEPFETLCEGSMWIVDYSALQSAYQFEFPIDTAVQKSVSVLLNNLQQMLSNGKSDFKKLLSHVEMVSIVVFQALKEIADAVISILQEHAKLNKAATAAKAVVASGKGVELTGAILGIFIPGVGHAIKLGGTYTVLTAKATQLSLIMKDINQARNKNKPVKQLGSDVKELCQNALKLYCNLKMICEDLGNHVSQVSSVMLGFDFQEERSVVGWHMLGLYCHLSSCKNTPKEVLSVAFVRLLETSFCSSNDFTATHDQIAVFHTAQSIIAAVDSIRSSCTALHELTNHVFGNDTFSLISEERGFLKARAIIPIMKNLGKNFQVLATSLGELDCIMTNIMVKAVKLHL